MPQTLAAMLPYTPPGLARALLAAPVLAPFMEAFPAAVLFADISGFTPLTEALAQRGAEGPEEMTRLLNTYFSRLIGAIEAEGGEVVKFSGDAVTALFPATAEPAGHAARRALQAAAAMHAFTGEFAAMPTSVGPIALSVKIGIGVGNVLAFRVGGRLERWEYVLAGDPLSQVAEAERAAKSGQTVLSSTISAVLADPATPAALDPRRVVAPQIIAATDLLAAATALRGFVPGALRAWLGQDVQDWLAALRPMSVLFIGMNGLDYTAEDGLARLQTFFASAQDVIYRYEGSINKLVVDDKGTVLLALFGAPPLAHADDAVRAAQAARELLDVAAAQGLAMAVGVATGPVFAGPVGSAGRREYTVMGDTVNRAARLMAVAGPDDMRCDFATMRDGRRVLAFDTLPPVHLKGKAGLAQVYRPIGPQPLQQRPGVALVGRLAELSRLRAAIKDAQAGRQRILLIEGDAGMGKSRLLAEFSRLCRMRDLIVLTGAGHSRERQTPYRAWREVFHVCFGIAPGADPAERRRRVHAYVADVAPEFEESLPLLNDLLGTEFPETSLTATLESERRHQGREALLIALLGRWAGERPLVLVLEDAHWMDTRSWGLALAVAYAMRSANLPGLLVLAMRPIERPDRPAELALLASGDGAVQMALGALEPEETLALAADRLGLPASELPPALARLLAARAGGNPFFAEEIVLALCDRGLIELGGEAGQRYCKVGAEFDTAALQLPETVQGVVLSRIDRLNPAAQMLLRVGSVIGRSFSYATLRAALLPYLSMIDTDLKSHLESLAGLNLTPQEAPDPDLRHVFKHAITRDVAYGTLLFSQRRELHRGVAQWYEARIARGAAANDNGNASVEDRAAQAQPGAEIVHLLAYHYQQAGDTQRERFYAALAGELAVASYANAEALVYLDRALELTPVEERAERRRLVMRREQVHDVCANRPAQAADIEMLSALCDAGDPRAQAELMLRRANFDLVTDDFPRAAETAEQAATLAHAADWPEGECIARRICGAALIPLARYAAARAELDQALDLARSAGLAGTEDDCLRDLGLIAYRQGDYPTASENYEKALAIDQAIGDRRGESATLVRLGAVARKRGDNAAVRACYQRALELDRATGDRDNEADALRGLGTLAYDQGDYLAARLAYTQSLEIETQAGDREGEAACLAWLGMVARARGEFGLARESLGQSLLINQAIGDRNYEAAVRADLALVCHQHGDAPAARREAEAAVKLARTIGAHFIEANALTRLGHALCGLADHAGAESAYQAALRLHRTHAAHTLALEPLAGLASLALASGDPAAARARADALATALEAGVSAWTVELPDILLDCYQVLNIAGDARAAQVLEAACARLDRQAAEIQDRAHREAFLTEVPGHRLLLAARAL